MSKPNNPVSAWSDETVNKVYSYHLDDMHPLDSIKLTNNTIEDKRRYLIEAERKFMESFK